MHSAFNIANALGAWLGGLVIAPGLRLCELVRSCQTQLPRESGFLQSGDPEGCSRLLATGSYPAIKVLSFGNQRDDIHHAFKIPIPVHADLGQAVH
jgi:hypothetical protein